MKNQTILGNTFISVAVLLTLTQLLAADTSESLLNPAIRPLSRPQPTFITFDAPGAVNGTYPSDMNPAGVITGYFADENLVGHGFVRAQKGTITTFDVPNAVFGTYPSDINPAGVVIGTFADENFVGHGFVRAPNGTITTFDVPEASDGFFFLRVSTRRK